MFPTEYLMTLFPPEYIPGYSGVLIIGPVSVFLLQATIGQAGACQAFAPGAMLCQATFGVASAIQAVQ